MTPKHREYGRLWESFPSRLPIDCCLDCPAPLACSQLAFPASPHAPIPASPSLSRKHGQLFTKTGLFVHKTRIRFLQKKRRKHDENKVFSCFFFSWTKSPTQLKKKPHPKIVFWVDLRKTFFHMFSNCFLLVFLLFSRCFLLLFSLPKRPKRIPWMCNPCLLSSSSKRFLWPVFLIFGTVFW